MAYADLLRDPRWQRKRLEVMADAGFACELCKATDKTLNVHHIQYVRGRMPWDYTRAELECLCEPCHKDEHGIGEKARKAAAKEKAIARDLAFRMDHPDAAAKLDRVDAIKKTLLDLPDGEIAGACAEMNEIREWLRENGFARWRQF